MNTCVLEGTSRYKGTVKDIMNIHLYVLKKTKKLEVATSVLFCIYCNKSNLYCDLSPIYQDSNSKVD